MANPIIAESNTVTNYFIKCCDNRVSVDSEGSVHCPHCDKRYKISLVEEQKKECDHKWYLIDHRVLKTTIEIGCENCDHVVRYVVYPDECL